MRMLSLVLALGIGLGATRARADACELDDARVQALADDLDRRTPTIQRKSRAWFWSFFSVQSAITVGAIGFALAEDEPLFRASSIWGAVGAGASTILMVAPPMPTPFLRRRLGARPEDPDALRAYVGRGIRLLERAESLEHAGRSPWNHVGNGAFALAQGLHLGLAYDDSLGVALFNALGTMAVAEAQAWSTPRIAGRTLDALARDHGACVRTLEPGPEVRVIAGFGTLTATVRW